MRALSALFLFFCLAGPASAQVYQRDVDRAGEAIASFPASSALACRASCDLNGGCATWRWTRPGVESPNGVCRLQSDAPAPVADTCCVSGVSRMIATLTPVADHSNQAATPITPAITFSTPAIQPSRPTGEPVTLSFDPVTGQPFGGDEGESESLAEQDAAQSSAARAQASPRREAGQPRYSVQREYEPQQRAAAD